MHSRTKQISVSKCGNYVRNCLNLFFSVNIKMLSWQYKDIWAMWLCMIHVFNKRCFNISFIRVFCL